MMVDQQIAERISEFPRWHYRFNLRGNITPIFQEDHVNRHEQRKKHFFDPLVKWYGGDLHGKRVLDLGCNAGFWSLSSVLAGCDYVLGIDGRRMHVEQANFVFQVHEVDSKRYRFIEDNIFNFTYEKYGPFDIILCLGLFYHINRHVELLRSMRSLNPEVLIIDTSLAVMKGSFLRVSIDDVSEPRMSTDYALVYYPTAEAVLALVSEFSFNVIMLRPECEDYTGAEDYKLGSRRAFVCSGRRDLTDFPAPTEELHELPYY